MQGKDFIAILPFLVLGSAVTVILLGIAIRRHHGVTAALAQLGLALALASLWPAASVAPHRATKLFLIDGFAIFFIGFVVVAGIIILLLSYDYLCTQPTRPEEYYLLFLLATLGAGTLVSSSHFASFFIGLETLSISLLGLIAYPTVRERPIEAGVKYLILAGLSSSLLLFGIALVYARLGTLEFDRLGAVAYTEALSDPYWLTGLALIISGIGFKLSFAPYHMWTPDVYEGAPAPVTAFIAVISKGAVFAVLLRLLVTVGAHASAATILFLNLLVIASILVGNTLALQQNNLKRILAYSSVAHLGYLLLALLAGGTLAIEAVSFYLSAYLVMMIGAFGTITVLSESGTEIDALEDYRGLMWRRPWLGGVLALMLLSLAGIPPTMGFFAKLYAIEAGVSGSLWLATFTLVLGSVIGLFYYLRVVVVMCTATPSVPGGQDSKKTPVAGGAALALLVLALIGFGGFPTPLIYLIKTVAANMVIK